MVADKLPFAPETTAVGAPASSARGQGAPAASAGLATGLELPELRQALVRVAALEEEKGELEASKAELAVRHEAVKCV